MKIKVLLVSSSLGRLNELKNMLSDDEIVIAGVSSGGNDALERVANLLPDIVIMTRDPGEEEALIIAERIALNRPRSFIILLAEQQSVELLRSAMRAGVHNIPPYPKSSKEFCDYVKTVYNNETARLESLSVEQKLTWSSKVITVFGAKGGLGKTTLAVNLAVKLAESRKKVALIDLDLQFGDVNIYLDIDPVDTIFELAQEPSSPSIDLLRSYMAIHSSGVHVLCAPKSPEFAELISADTVKTILSQLRTYYDYVIIDTPPSFNEVTLSAIEASTTVLFVTGLDISILKNSKLSLSVLNSLQQIDKVKVIVNRAVNIGSITLDDIQKLIDSPIWAKIPSDYKTAVTALNLGVPFVTGAPKSELSQAVSSVAALLIDGTLDYDSLSAKQRKQLGIKRTRKESKSRKDRS
ncbi:MAG: MinD/ParA family protein [Clostridiales bacterium]|jgi:pilus assembly protein CpaE|nr:MinD/ParA family protein [Clostridiales bacterium]